MRPIGASLSLSLALVAVLHEASVHGKHFKLPYDHTTDHLNSACWTPDYCNPDHFRYRLCRLRFRRSAKGKKQSQQYSCPEGEYCEELECEHKCWLPSNCSCVNEHKGPDGAVHEHEGRMFCSKDCFKNPSTQWGLCRPEPPEHEYHHEEDGGGDDDDDDEEAFLPTGFHFYTPAPGLHNSKLHIDEDSPMARERVPPPVKDEL